MIRARASVPHHPCVVLGFAPAKTGAPAWAADSPSGARLAELVGVVPAQLPALFALDNLWPAPKPDHAQLREAAQLYQFLPGWWYVLAGSGVLKAFGKRARPADAAGWWDQRVLEWYDSREGVTMAVLPHPSGLTRWYNDQANRERAEKFLRAAASNHACTGAGGAHRAWRADRARHDQARQEARRVR